MLKRIYNMFVIVYKVFKVLKCFARASITFCLITKLVRRSFRRHRENEENACSENFLILWRSDQKQRKSSKDALVRHLYRDN